MAEEWKEVKLKRGGNRKIWEFQRGYNVNKAGKHEDEKAFRAFQHYLNSGGARSMIGTAEACGNGAATVTKWYETYEWAKRCAAWDKQQMAITFKEANAAERKRHRQNIQEFRQANEDQARMMMDVSNDLMNIIQRRIAKAEEEDENIPMGLLSGLMRAASQISDTGRQAWATSLGVSELMQVVDQELEEAASVEDVDIYEIPLDED
jgi:hypothetical protein